MTQVQLWPLLTSVVPVAAQPVVVALGPMLGGLIVNPQAAADQALNAPEGLYVDVLTEANLQAGGDTILLQPGQRYNFPPGTMQVTVNARTSGHKFAGLVIQVPPDFQPLSSGFPPSGPPLDAITPSYLYQQYADDDDLQAFVRAYNALAQNYMNWFASINLPVYTSPTLNGSLLDWVAAGLYGITRPTLPSGLSQILGPYNTYDYNTLAYNQRKVQGPSNYYVTNDDIFKRVITWHFYKGDGKVFNVRWLKRRVMRFLTGTNGTAGMTDETYPVSVTFGVDNAININLQGIKRFATGGAIYGVGRYNEVIYNDLKSSFVSMPVSPFVPVFKAAMDAGVLETPFQYTFVVNT